MEPLVSIIMATYNRAHLIAETLDSIIAQTHKHWECIIIDDGSTDHVKEVIDGYIAIDKRFTYHSREDSYKKGLPGCRNMGLDKATGDFIVFFDDDDIVHPDNLYCCVKELRTETYDFCRYERAVFYGDFDIPFDRTTQYDTFEISNNDHFKVLSNKLPFNSCAVVWRGSCLGKYRFKEDLMYAEEWELYNRILSQDILGTSIKKVLFYGRKHEQSNTGEFAKKDPVRIASKVKAAKYLIRHFDAHKLIDRDIGMYMFAVMYLTGNKEVGREVLRAKNIKPSDRLYLNLRYYLLPLTVPLGKLLKK